ncbi:uncharacterized protein EDB91DRAFT_1124069, partial [Suillus paluster]|uniref:uncharacterized protein n=1 Tax=Suillus paluster TaxID=48578 RepID=UPI001B85D3CB
MVRLNVLLDVVSWFRSRTLASPTRINLVLHLPVPHFYCTWPLEPDLVCARRHTSHRSLLPYHSGHSRDDQHNEMMKRARIRPGEPTPVLPLHSEIRLQLCIWILEGPYNGALLHDEESTRPL